MTPLQIAAVDHATLVADGIRKDYPGVYTLIAIHGQDVAIQFWREAAKMASVGARLSDVADYASMAKRFEEVGRAIRNHLNELQKTPSRELSEINGN